MDHSIVEDWVLWEKEIHIPEIMGTGLFRDYKFYQLLEHDDEGGQNFVIQFFADSRDDCDTFLVEFASQLQKQNLAKWGDKTGSFQTLLQNVQ